MSEVMLDEDVLKAVVKHGQKIAETKDCFDDFSFDIKATPTELKEVVPQYLSAFEQASGTEVLSLEIDNSGRNYYFDGQAEGAFDYKEQLADFNGRDDYVITITFALKSPSSGMKNLIKTVIGKMPASTTASLQEVFIGVSQARVTFSCLVGKLESAAKLTFCITDATEKHALLLDLWIAVSTPELPVMAELPKTKKQFLALLQTFTPDQLEFSYTGNLLHSFELADVSYPEVMNIEPNETEGKNATVIALQQALGDFDMDGDGYENADLIIVRMSDRLNCHGVSDAAQIRQMVYDAWVKQYQQ